MKAICIISILCLFHVATTARADSFRCGTRIVVTGDSINRLLRSCGHPAFKVKAREAIGSRGDRQLTAVTNWVYERGRRRDMIVSVRSGKVVRIAVE